MLTNKQIADSWNGNFGLGGASWPPTKENMDMLCKNREVQQELAFKKWEKGFLTRKAAFRGSKLTRKNNVE